MRSMSAKHEEQRARQAKLIQEKREAKMKKQKEREDLATGLVREASALDEMWVLTPISFQYYMFHYKAYD